MDASSTYRKCILMTNMTSVMGQLLGGVKEKLFTDVLIIPKIVQEEAVNSVDGDGKWLTFCLKRLSVVKFQIHKTLQSSSGLLSLHGCQIRFDKMILRQSV